MENELNNINYNNKNNGPNNIIAERGKNMSMISTKTKKSEKTKRNIVSKIKINKFFITFCFLCIKKRKNYQNILINEGMNIITQYLDVLNIFKKLFIDGKIQKQLNDPKDDIIKMTAECVKNLQNMNIPLNKD